MNREAEGPTLDLEMTPNLRVCTLSGDWRRVIKGVEARYVLECLRPGTPTVINTRRVKALDTDTAFFLVDFMLKMRGKRMNAYWVFGVEESSIDVFSMLNEELRNRGRDGRYVTGWPTQEAALQAIGRRPSLLAEGEMQPALG